MASCAISFYFFSYLLLFSYSIFLFVHIFSHSLYSLLSIEMRSFDKKKKSVAKNDFRQVVVASNRTKLGNDTSECTLGILRKWVERSKC